MVLQAGFNIVGVQDGVTGSIGYALAAHHGDISMRDNQYRGRTPWRCRNSVDRLTFININHRVAGQVRNQVISHTNWAHNGAAATVRDTESFVQVQVANISPN